MEKPTHGFRTITKQHARQSRTHSSQSSRHVFARQALGWVPQKGGLCAGEEGAGKTQGKQDLSLSPEAPWTCCVALGKLLTVSESPSFPVLSSPP